MERLNSAIVVRFRHYMAEHQPDWEHYMQPWTYLWNTPLYRSTYTMQSGLILSRQPLGSTTSIPAPLTKGKLAALPKFCIFAVSIVSVECPMEPNGRYIGHCRRRQQIQLWKIFALITAVLSWKTHFHRQVLGQTAYLACSASALLTTVM